MHVILIIQGRCNSSLIPYKIIKDLSDNTTMIEHVISRCQQSQFVNQLIVSTTTNSTDDKLVNVLDTKNILSKISFYRGSETNILDRIYQTAKMSRADVIIRVQANRPLIDVNVIDAVLKFYLDNQYDYIYLGNKKRFPDSFGFDIVNFKTLHHIHQRIIDPYDLEHYESYIKSNPKDYRSYQYNLSNPSNFYHFDMDDYPNIDFNRLTLEIKSQSDWKYMKRLFTTIYGQKSDFGMTDVLQLLNDNPEFISYPAERKQVDDPNFYGKGQELVLKATSFIPNGVNSMSHFPDSQLPGLFPGYYFKSGDIEITTLNGVKLKDFSTMASGSCILGYRDPDVDSAVHDTIERGNLTSLSSPNEVKLAKELIELHPWSSFARFTKSESDAISIAIRIARAYTGKNKILISGYQGWHDTVLSANELEVTKKNRQIFVKPEELSRIGVDSKLIGSCQRVDIHNYEEVEKLVKKQHTNLAGLLIEPADNKPISEMVLQKLRALTTQYNMLLIINEIKYGFRVNTGGLHLVFDLEPDLVIFGNSISNGYNLSAILGRNSLMTAAKKVFASDISWADDIGLNASLETINKHKNLNIGKQIRSVGRYFQSELSKIAKKHNIHLKIEGMPAIVQFHFNLPDTPEYQDYVEYTNGETYKFGDLNKLLKTLYVQLMLKYGILATTLFYPSYAHTFKRVDYYLSHIEKVFAEIKLLIATKSIHKVLLVDSLAKPSYQAINC